jgi:hypothetical protein
LSHEQAGEGNGAVPAAGLRLRIFVEREYLGDEGAADDPVEEVWNESKDKEVFEFVSPGTPHHDVSLVADRAHEPRGAGEKDCHSKGNEAHLSKRGWSPRESERVCVGERSREVKRERERERSRERQRDEETGSSERAWEKERKSHIELISQSNRDWIHQSSRCIVTNHFSDTKIDSIDKEYCFKW